MKGLLILKNIKVENANAIAGMTYGFPAISNFLGFAHALSRKLEKKCGLSLGGCAVVCHEHEVNMHASSTWGEHIFALTRNPLTSKGETAAFNEEARMHMRVSLIIETNFSDIGINKMLDNDHDFSSKEELLHWIKEQSYIQRMAGGTILNIESAACHDYSADMKKLRTLLFSLLPGFFLVDRNDLLKSHFAKRRVEQPSIELIDVWLDFVRLTYQAETDEENPEKAEWTLQSKPETGWLVPLAIGFQGISPLHKAGAVKNARDEHYPFQFVEAMYSIGQWISPHRIREHNIFESLFWHYQYQPNHYLCHNHFQKPTLQTHQEDINND
jgi:CRISPR-associated protein Csy2